MASLFKKFLTGINLQGNGLKQAKFIEVHAEVLDADPSEPIIGRWYFNSSTNRLRLYNGSLWVDYPILSEVTVKQDKEDNNLSTPNKTVVGAINYLDELAIHEVKLSDDTPGQILPGGIIVIPAVSGIRGYQGFQGYTGPQGVQGHTGPQGSQGYRGYRGYQGHQGTQGDFGERGTQGWQGFRGIQGYTGTQGAQGYTGTQGAQGNQGNQGFRGVQGYTGPQGASGDDGKPGSTGPQGAEGQRGFQGSTGDTGPTGVQGSIGTRGYQGYDGSTGPTGAQGADGTDGTDGTRGFQGYQGYTGSQGFQGYTGSQGYQGNRGHQGYQGNDSIVPGPTGPQGPINYMPIENKGTSDTTITCQWDKKYQWGEVASLDISLAAAPNDGVWHEIIIEFTSGATPTNLAISGVSWETPNDPDFSSNQMVEISIDNRLKAVYKTFDL